MDHIILKGLVFRGRHGVFEYEKEHHQKFIINGILFLDLKKAGRSDAISHTLDYKQAHDHIKKIVTGESYNLIEALAEAIAESLFKAFELLQKIELEIQKPEASINGEFDYFGVKIFRTRP